MIKSHHIARAALALLMLVTMDSPSLAAGLDITDAAVVVSPGERGAAETVAATILVEEVEKRSGRRLAIQHRWPDEAKAVISLSTRGAHLPWREWVPEGEAADLPETRPEGFALRTSSDGKTGQVRVFVIGADGRGVMYGVGRLLRALCLDAGKITLDTALDVSSAPEYPIRGHQLGYRPRANSYDAWTPAQFDQYVRELIIFGANAIECIPFQDQQSSPLMPIPRPRMNRTLSEICAKYDVDYWAWTPADFSLKDESRRKAAIEQHEAFYRDCVRLDAVFFPGGDPGDNPPELVIPFVKELAGLLGRYHPKAKVWVSLQGFDGAKTAQFLEFIEKELPKWLGGLVVGPGSPPMERSRLPRQYALRWYPDIAHTVRCQFPVEWWDPAFALTLGREPPNPRPADYAAIFRLVAPYSNGFVTYSDGINDDANKSVLSMLGWDSHRDVREMMLDYAHFFFGADVAEPVADGLLGLENNWRGSLALNTEVDGILALWQRIEKRAPRLLSNWRFQMFLLRAYYDAYTRHRLINEMRLERDAMSLLGRAKAMGPGRAMDAALEQLRQADVGPNRKEWRTRILQLADDAFQSIGYQTSVKKYHASEPERGCVLDFLDYPLNNRWWIEDEFVRIRAMPVEEDQLARLDLIRTWDDPGPGSFYDEVGHVGRSPHVIRGQAMSAAAEGGPRENPEHSWWDEGMSRRRLSWQHHMKCRAGMVYEGLDPSATYTIRITGQGDSFLRANGTRLTPTRSSNQIGEFKVFPVPPALTSDGQLRLTWDEPDESHLNWRQRWHVAEVWLLKK